MNGLSQEEMFEELLSSGKCKSTYLATLLSAILVTAILIYSMEKRERENAKHISLNGIYVPSSTDGFTVSGKSSP